jgi:hypothetical protein
MMSFIQMPPSLWTAATSSRMTRTVLRTLVLSGVFVFTTSLVGCDGASKVECATNADCDELQVCTEEGECDSVECLTSTDCDIYEYCDDDPDDYECEPGCAEDTDCMAGETCDTETHACSAYGCRSTQLDCEYGQYCDQVTGTCYDDEREHCETCDIFSGGGGCGGGSCYVSTVGQSCDIDYGGADCPIGEDCAIFEVDSASSCNSDANCPGDQVCDYIDLDGNGTGDGYFCHSDFCFTAACFYNCTPSEGEEACPRGFSCIDFDDGTTPVCIGDCEFMTDGGYLE